MNRNLSWRERKCGKIFTDGTRKKLPVLAALFLGALALLKGCGASGTSGDTIGTAMLMSLSEEAESLLGRQFMPGIAFASESVRGGSLFLREQITAQFPFFGYAAKYNRQGEEADGTDFRTIILAEAEEGSTFGEEQISGMPESGDPAGTGSGGEGQSPAPEQAPVPEESMEELLRAENELAAAGMQQNSFIPHMKQNQVDLTALSSYEALIKQFYTIDGNTTAGSDQLNVEKLLERDMRISKDGEGPQILIYHTHSQEAFADSVPGDASTSIMGVGEHLTEILRETYGYNVLHHMGQYDTESRDDSYSAALTDIEQVLKDYPSIQVVIDLHRDEMPEGTRLAMDLDGRPTARFMFFNGLSRTKKTGNIAYLYNENLDGNLAFSFQMQLKAMEYYPNLTRRIYLKGYRYNMHLKPRCLLVELGAQNNTVEEAMNACDPLAHILDLVLSGEE